jgi:23S rRNA pseudouridine2604 synthase
LENSNENSISLNKYISNTGICSRRAANQLIQDKKVKLNGVVAQLGNRVSPGDKVTINGKPIKSPPKSIYIALNKPIGIVSTTDKKERKNIIDFVGHKERLFPIGRLDKPSQGLIFLTNDGDIVNKILRAGNSHEKEYVVRVDKIIDQNFVNQMAKGVPILGTVTKRCKVSKINKTVFKITLTQGLNRQIRRMCEHLGYDVKTLKRTRIMNVELGNLKVGEWRYLTKNEIREINSMVADSSKTAE